ncbi:hypothetical protein C8J34_104370 [Rhizobium sp. PP-F2F-G36]|nr:hypothetical protein C8J34_104370 [Rhizobium sp. PP-F2F-G36]
MTAVSMDAIQMPRPAGRPVTFENTVGLFTPAQGVITRAAVLFISPWGLEELCVHKAWRELADSLADAGMASLRYDHPGTGDALDLSEPSGLEPFTTTALAAARCLRDLCGLERLVVVAQGFGSLSVPDLLKAHDPSLRFAGVALLAPVTSGRRYLRELSLWAKVVDEGLGLPPGSGGPGTSIAGLVMEDSVAAAVRSADAKAFKPAGSARFFIAERPQSDADGALAVQLQTEGADVTRVVFDGYSDLVSNPTIAETPVSVFKALTSWILGLDASQLEKGAGQGALSSGVLDGGSFIECPMRFGAEDRLFGILCTPADAIPVGTALLLGTGYDRQSGWARSTVETARMLAASGIASFRFDAAGIADSPPVPEGDRQVLYSPGQISDVRAALDRIEAIGLPDPVFVGRCSGAYLAFNAALADPRCRGVIAINILTFAWDPRDDVDQMIRYNPRSLDDYKRRALRMETAYRLISGKIDVPRAAGNILKIVARRVSRTAAPVLGSLSVEARLRNGVHRAFRQLRERHVPVSLVYSEGDIGLARLTQHFGRDGQLLARYPNVSRILLANADHNVTPPKARRELREHIRDTILAIVSGTRKAS